MDDLYDNLENYHDEKIIDELKSENKDLKAKLEEYSSAMTRLQMDFDKLNSEYKNLEMNYSSLLKTARAEIERKSEMIKSLNTEKDLLIIKSIQTSGKNILNTKRHFFDTRQLKKSHESDTKCDGKPGPQSSNQNEEKMHRNNRINSTHTQSEYTIPDLENKSNFSEDKELRDTHSNFRNKTDKSKENITTNIHKDDSVKRKGEKVSKRRKSMPFCRNIEPIFSSDDDFEALNLKNIRKSPLREDIRHFDKRSNENCSSKDRFYSNRTNRYTHGKYIHDRYESSAKYTRHSPEKYRSKYTNQHSENHRSRGDYKNSRQRVLRSPPTDKYNRSKSRDRKTFERESYYDNQEREHSAHIHDNSVAVKYRSKNELDEPSSKRQKTEQNKKGSIEQNEREIEHSLKGSLIKQDFMEPTSCQSPDYVNIENSIPQHVVKEIKHTAATPLEDPRMSSKKYVIKTNKDRTVLTTVNSADVDIKPITVSAWNIPDIKTFMIPPTLSTEQLPAKTNNDFVNEINMDIDSSLLNDSLESGEIQTDYENHYTKDSGVDKLQENKKSNNEDHSKTSNTLTDIDSDNIRNNATNKYKIPKIKKPAKICTNLKHEDLSLLAKKQNPIVEYCNEDVSLLSKKQNPAIEYGNDDTELVRENYGNGSTLLQETPNIKNEIIKISTVLPEKTLVCTLAEDLELSDEASESRDIHNDAKKSIKTFPKRKPSVDFVDLNKQKRVNSVNDQIINSDERSKPITQLKKTPKDSSKDSGKTRRSKKKTELKDTSTETRVQKELKTDNKINSKPAISIETKNKFSDLFGDSSSLITPDDLGLPHPEIQLPLTDKYVSIYDNTQDAIDLSVADINREKCNASKSSTFAMLPEDQSNDKTIIDKTQNYTEKPQVHKDFVGNTNANNLPEQNLYEKSAINNDSKILKTVIISTGIQPKYTSESIPAQHNEDIECTDKILNNKTNMKSCMLNNIKALATSTPQKTEHVGLSAPITDPVVNDANDAIIDNTNLSCTVSNASNSNEILNEADVPDVRLFVRRRRKIIKKP